MRLAAVTWREAGLIFAMCGCVLLGVVKEQSEAKEPEKNQRQRLESSGARIFESRCAGCHGLDGHGTERGPNIASTENAQRQSDAALRRTIRHGIAGTGMPAFSTLSDGETQSVVSYLRRLQGSREISGTGGTAQTGQSLFFGKARCAECHSVGGQGGFIASDLSGFGRTHSALEIRRVILSPGEVGKRGDLTKVKARDGREFSGLVRNEDNFSLQLQTLDGSFEFFVKSEIAGIQRAGPLMPADYGSKLSGAELTDLVAFLARVSGPRRVKPKADDFEE